MSLLSTPTAYMGHPAPRHLAGPHFHAMAGTLALPSGQKEGQRLGGGEQLSEEPRATVSEGLWCLTGEYLLSPSGWSFCIPPGRGSMAFIWFSEGLETTPPTLVMTR